MRYVLTNILLAQTEDDTVIIPDKNDFINLWYCFSEQNLVNASSRF
uniref:Uncharacterized protein n=1 Tax=Arundo donax TaxID=35708 RepID=A0A0A8XZF8_ARUDO